MEKYDYRKAIKSDIIDYIEENFEPSEVNEENWETIYDALWVSDSVTGNASGSYFCNTWEAEEALCHNLDIISDISEDWGITAELTQSSAEAWDVRIRCYLLGEVLSDVLAELEEEREA